MIHFEQEQDGPGLLLIYTPENNDGGWIKHQLTTTGRASLCGRVFNVKREQWLEPDEVNHNHDEVKFIFSIGDIASPYYCIEREVLGINYDLAIHVSIELERKIFVAERNISIFRRFNDYGLSELIIGGDDEGAIPRLVFYQLISRFPNSHELTLYAKARISSIVRNYVSIERDEHARYEKYLNKKDSYVGADPLRVLAPYEYQKFEDLVDNIEDMLKNAKAYNEAQWQKEILQVILLLFPRYIKAFREGPVNDSWAHTTRRVDFLLVDSTGYIDVIEIKKPMDMHLVSANDYRGNYVPMKDLGGTIMQVEKYLYHFNRWGLIGEQILTKKYQSELPEGLKIKIVNPNGLIIMGRDFDLTVDQRNDFEVIRRKYRNVVDIITYDDLLRRLRIIRDQFKALKG